MIGREKQKMLPVRKKIRPALRAEQTLIECREALCVNLMRMDDPDHVAITRSIDDRVVGAPSAATRIRRVGDGRDGAAGRWNDFQFPIRKKSDGSTIRRPKREQRSICPSKFPGQIRIERLNPERISLFRAARAESNLGAVGREDWRSGEITVEIESCVWRRKER